MKKSNSVARIILTALVTVTLGLSTQAWSQTSNSFDVPRSDAPLSTADLEILVGPIALYPDDLIGIVLPASTYPLQIVQAGRFLDALQQDSTLQPDPNWDDSVVALLNYPEALRMLDTNIEWTWALGEAVLDQQAAVMDAIQSFRGQALLAGNLTSDSQQTVSQSGNLIEIAPADPEVIYIPYYEPERVVVVQPRPVVYYYADPYPLYYYPYPVGYRFRTGFFWGVTTAFHIGWNSHLLNVFHHHHYLHPYYGRTYYTPWYPRRGLNININVNRRNPVWQPRDRRAARPTRFVNRDRVTVNREGQVNSRQRRTTTTTTRTQVPGARTTTRSGRANSPTTQTRTQIERNAQRNAINQAERQRSVQQNRNTETRRQRSNTPMVPPQRSNRTNTQVQRADRAIAQPQRSNRITAQPQRSNRSAAPPQRPNRTIAPTPRRSNNAGAASSGQVRQRSQPSRPAGSGTRSGSRQSGSNARSSARTGQGTQNGRTRR